MAAYEIDHQADSSYCSINRVLFLDRAILPNTQYLGSPCTPTRLLLYPPIPSSFSSYPHSFSTLSYGQYTSYFSTLLPPFPGLGKSLSSSAMFEPSHALAQGTRLFRTFGLQHTSYGFNNARPFTPFLQNMDLLYASAPIRSSFATLVP